MTTSMTRVTFVKADVDGSAMSTYTVLLDDEPIGTVSKVREHYLRRLGGHRGNNARAARTAWTASGFRNHHDTRVEAAIDLVVEIKGIGYGDALDIVRGKA